MKMFAGWSLKLMKLVVIHLEANLLSNEVIVHFNMLGLLMKDWVGSNV